MSIVVTAPAQTRTEGTLRSLFLAGGITGCRDWQAEVIAALGPRDLLIYNPRRADFPIGDPSAAPEQIAWEHRALAMADAILFWFPAESVCPIALYELGAWSTSHKPLFIATHPEYPRRLDVIEQTLHSRPELRVGDSLLGLIADVDGWAV